MTPTYPGRPSLKLQSPLQMWAYQIIPCEDEWSTAFICNAGDNTDPWKYKPGITGVRIMTYQQWWRNKS